MPRREWLITKPPINSQTLFPAISICHDQHLDQPTRAPPRIAERKIMRDPTSSKGKNLPGLSDRLWNFDIRTHVHPRYREWALCVNGPKINSPPEINYPGPHSSTPSREHSTITGYLFRHRARGRCVRWNDLALVVSRRRRGLGLGKLTPDSHGSWRTLIAIYWLGEPASVWTNFGKVTQNFNCLICAGSVDKKRKKLSKTVFIWVNF